MTAPSHQEITLRITDDRLNHWDCKKFVNRPFIRNTSGSPSCDNDLKHACCSYSLYHTDNQLWVFDVKLINSQIWSEFEWVHIVPHKPQQECTEYRCVGVDQINDNMLIYLDAKVIIDEDTALNESNPTRYAFDLVFSTSSELSPDRSNITEETPRITEKSLKDTESGKPSKNACAEQSFRDLCPEKYEDMLTFLRDPESVNTAFVFTIHSCSIRIALWAHCAILKKYPAFQELLTSHRSANTVALSYGPIVVPVEGISLTTFCVLLKYIYTEDIDLAVDDSQFLMSDMGPSDTPSDATVLNNALRERNASQFYASWEAKDKVTWVDLFLAADRFGVQKLRQHSLKSLLVSVDKHNAMEMLFGVGPHFKTEVRDPVMKYISEHLDDVFSVQTEDPFKRYADHENCHEVMLELLRLERSR